jgi:phage terminase large subunit-like protein
VRELAARFQVQEVCADPWRWGQAALELERDGLVASQFPQTDVRMVPASQRLRDAVIERRLTLPPDARLAEHSANAVQRHGRRGWRLDRPDRSSPIDALVALCMALDRVEQRPEPVRLLGWLG